MVERMSIPTTLSNVQVILKGFVPEQTDEETKGELTNPCSCGKRR